MTDAGAVLRRFLEDAWSARQLDRFPDHVSPDVRLRPPRGPARDRQGYRETADDLLRALPGIRFTVERVIAVGDVASARLVIEGTNDGPFRGRPATGKRVRVVGHPPRRVEDGRIVEFWRLFDELGMLQRMGHVTGP